MRILQSNRGSSSVLVAMVLIILVVFSVLGVTTSVSNLRLAEKYAGTVGVYYSLDSEGERFLYEIREDVSDSLKKADDAINALSKGDFTQAKLPDSISENIEKTWSGLTADDKKQQYLTSLLPKLVIYYTEETIGKAYPESISDSAADYLVDSSLYGDSNVPLSFNVKWTFILEYENNYRYLNVVLNVADPAKGKSPDEICTVREWRLWQEPFEYKNEIDLWEGRP